jgi:hypothetical protein
VCPRFGLSGNLVNRGNVTAPDSPQRSKLFR